MAKFFGRRRVPFCARRRACSITIVLLCSPGTFLGAKATPPRASPLQEGQLRQGVIIQRWLIHGCQRSVPSDPEAKNAAVVSTSACPFMAQFTF